METEYARMQQTARDAAAIGDNLKTVMVRLDNAMGVLVPMDGMIKNAFWQGHRGHLDAMTKLCNRLHQLADGIGDAKSKYQSADDEGQVALNQAANVPVLDATVL
ncbi:WXG100 family type VII secretion target [Kribbella sp. NPDC054772]